MIGKHIRLERIIDRNTRRTVIIPMDHGVSVGPITGLIDMKKTIDAVVSGGANGIILHKGIVVSGHRGKGEDIGLIIHLSASTSLNPDPNDKVLVCSVEEAIRLGADAVSIHVNIGALTESSMIKDFGQISKACMDWGMPLIAMMYARGEKVAKENDPSAVKLAARVAAELGADIAKVTYTGNADSFHEVVAGCPIPVVIAGGEKSSTEQEFLRVVHDAISAGANGVTIGRNVFSYKEPMKMVKAISSIVHAGKTPEQAHELLK